jgi:HK97 family phage major capsid protein
MNLQEQLAAKINAAKTALERANVAGISAEDQKAALDEARAARQEAESIKSRIEEFNALADLSQVELKTMRPNLPGTQGNSNMPQVEPKTEANGGDSKSATPAEGSGTLNAAYVTRFGSTEKMVDGILTDIHGADYEGKFWAQKASFRKYLRGGEQALRSEDHQNLSQVVMTPSVVKMALAQGVEDVQSYRTTMVEAADTLGGYMVPVDFQMRLLEQLAGLTVIRGRASQMNTSRDRVEFPEATGASGKYTSPVRVTWVDETPTLGSVGEVNLTFGLRGVSVHTAMAEAPLSRNLIEDSAFDIEAYLAKKLAEAAAIDEDKQFIVGNGVGKPLGLLPGSANYHSFREVNSGGASSLTWDGLIKVPFSVPAQYRQQKSVWLMNKATLQTIALIKDSNFGYLLQPYQFGGGEGNPIGSQLLGYPVLEDEDMPDIASNSFPILFGDMSAYQIIDRLGMTVERFLDSATARQNLIYYVMRRRLGGQPIETWRLSTQKVAS